MNTIFPNSCHDVDWRIVLCLDDNKDNDGLVALSGVNRKAFELISNDRFAEFFKRQHSQLIRCGLNFQVLAHFHPSNCWKVACCSFSRGVFKVNKPFLEMAIPLLCDSLKNKKREVEETLKGICGDFYADPNSPIHIAWDLWQTCRQKRNEKKLEIEALNKALFPFYSEGDMECVYRLCKHRGDDLLLSEEGGFVGDFSSPEFEFINPAHISHYQKIVISIREFDSGNQEDFQLWGEYDALEKRRIACEKELRAVEKELSSLVPGEMLGLGLQKHASRLSNEFERLWRAEEALLNSPILQQCLELCLEALRQQTVSEDLKNQIRSLTNSCSCEVKTAIWSQLYFECANGTQEDQWSENHFHEFLIPFMSIFVRRLNHESMAILDAKQTQLNSLPQ